LTREAGAGFVDAFEFTVAEDLGIGVIDLERPEEGNQGCTLFRGAGIGIVAILVQALFNFIKQILTDFFGKIRKIV